MEIPFDSPLPSLDVAAHTIWVVGHPAVISKLADSYYDVPNAPDFHHIDSIDSVHNTLQVNTLEGPQLLFISTKGLSFADFERLAAVRDQYPDVPIAICFAGQHLGYVSYAWALNFAAYLTFQDLSADNRSLINQIHHYATDVPMYSPVFCDWLRQYGILFEGDQLPHYPLRQR